MSEVPSFVTAVPSPWGIRTRIMAAAAVPAGTAFSTGGKMPAVRGGMGKYSGAVPGEGKVFRLDQPKANRGQQGKNGKDQLECSFRIAGGRLTGHDILYDVLSGN